MTDMLQVFMSEPQIICSGVWWAEDGDSFMERAPREEGSDRSLIATLQCHKTKLRQWKTDYDRRRKLVTAFVPFRYDKSKYAQMHVDDQFKKITKQQFRSVRLRHPEQPAQTSRKRNRAEADLVSDNDPEHRDLVQKYAQISKHMEEARRLLGERFRAR